MQRRCCFFSSFSPFPLAGVHVKRVEGYLLVLRERVETYRGQQTGKSQLGEPTLSIAIGREVIPTLWEVLCVLIRVLLHSIGGPGAYRVQQRRRKKGGTSSCIVSQRNRTETRQGQCLRDSTRSQVPEGRMVLHNRQGTEIRIWEEKKKSVVKRLSAGPVLSRPTNVDERDGGGGDLVLGLIWA